MTAMTQWSSQNCLKLLYRYYMLGLNPVNCLTEPDEFSYPDFSNLIFEGGVIWI